MQNSIGKEGPKTHFTVNTVEDRLYAQLIIRDNPELYQSLKQEREEMGEALDWHPPEEAQGDSKRRKNIPPT